MTKRVMLLLVFAFTSMFQATLRADVACEHPPGVAYFSRHAKKAGSDGAGLQDAVGFDQANALSIALEDEGITHIYVTDILRTQQTADPLVQRISVDPIEIPRANPKRQFQALCDHGADDRVLVIGHREKMPGILADLGFGNIVFGYCKLYRIDFKTMKIEADKYCDDAS